MALTDTAIHNLKPQHKPYKKSDSGGLPLQLCRKVPSSGGWHTASPASKRPSRPVHARWLRWRWRAKPKTRQSACSPKAPIRPKNAKPTKGKPTNVPLPRQVMVRVYHEPSGAV